jgi:branched-chain amino acid transport system permease protein
MLIGQIANGVIIGAVYALLALGFTLVFGLLDKLNFAHPEAFMFGGFVGVLAAAGSASAPGAQALWIGLPVAMVVGGLFGLVTELLCFRKFRGEDGKITAALSSVALGIVAVDLTQKIWGSEPVTIAFHSPWLEQAITLGGVRIPYLQLLILGLTLLLMAALHWLVARTSFGRQVRAVAESPINAALFGVNVRRVTSLVFFVSSALAAGAGLLLALRHGLAASDIGLTFGLKAIAIMAIGGIGDMRGAVVAGFIIGIAEALTYEFGLGRLGEMTAWATMILFLLFRPNGLFGHGLHSGEVRA